MQTLEQKPRRCGTSRVLLPQPYQPGHHTPRMDGNRLRAVMRRVVASVAIVTAAGDDERRGITISSFTSVSLDPPLVSFNVRRQARMCRTLQAASDFVVHVLSDKQAALSAHFARPGQTGTQQFSPIAHRIRACGSPVLEAALAVLCCRRYALYPAGDHVIVVGRVVAIEEAASGQPLLYYDRTYRTIGSEIATSADH